MPDTARGYQVVEPAFLDGVIAAHPQPSVGLAVVAWVADAVQQVIDARGAGSPRVTAAWVAQGDARLALRLDFGDRDRDPEADEGGWMQTAERNVAAVARDECENPGALMSLVRFLSTRPRWPVGPDPLPAAPVADERTRPAVRYVPVPPCLRWVAGHPDPPRLDLGLVTWLAGGVQQRLAARGFTALTVSPIWVMYVSEYPSFGIQYHEDRAQTDAREPEEMERLVEICAMEECLATGGLERFLQFVETEPALPRRPTPIPFPPNPEDVRPRALRRAMPIGANDDGLGADGVVQPRSPCVERRLVGIEFAQRLLASGSPPPVDLALMRWLAEAVRVRLDAQGVQGVTIFVAREPASGALSLAIECEDDDSTRARVLCERMERLVEHVAFSECGQPGALLRFVRFLGERPDLSFGPQRSSDQDA